MVPDPRRFGVVERLAYLRYPGYPRGRHIKKSWAEKQISRLNASGTFCTRDIYFSLFFRLNIWLTRTFPG